MISFSRSRILCGVRLFFVLALTIQAGAIASEPTTTEGRINRNAYPLTRYPTKYEALPKSVDAELRSRIAQVLTPIKLAPASWFRSTFGSSPSASDRRKILESFQDTEIWKCQGDSCSGCTGGDVTGCVLGNSVAGGIGVVALIHPCVYGEGKCVRGGSSDLGAWAERFVFGIAYYKSGLQKDNSAMRKAAKASSEWLLKTSHSVNQMLAACPGPYPAESLKFLFELEAVTLPNSAILKCGQGYIDELRVLPSRCKDLKGTLKTPWDAFSKEQLRASADVLRCDAYCLKMLCRQKDAGTLFTRFSGKPALLIGDGACEGETLKLRGRFLRAALPRLILQKLESTGCLPPEESASVESTGGSEPTSGEILVE